LKRGGGAQTVSLDFDGAEREVLALRHTTQPEPEAFFHQEFVRSLFEKTVEELRSEYAASGRSVYFTLFEKYDLMPVEGVSYAQLAREFNLTPTQVTNYLAQVRRRFRERALATLSGLCGSEQEYRREARELFGVEI
jgi:hypothetical protein